MSKQQVGRGERGEGRGERARNRVRGTRKRGYRELTNLPTWRSEGLARPSDRYTEAVNSPQLWSRASRQIGRCRFRQQAAHFEEGFPAWHLLVPVQRDGQFKIMM
jgi:hypothetical protein